MTTTLSLTITDPSTLVITGENLAVEVRAMNSPETASVGYSVDPEAPKDSVNRTGRRNGGVGSHGAGAPAEGSPNPGRTISPSAPADAVTVAPQAPRLVTAPLSHSSEPTSSPVKTDKAGASGGSSAPAAYSPKPAHGPCQSIARKPSAIEPALVAPAGDTDPIVRYSTTPPANPRKLRPNCLKPDNCAGYGSHTCHACTVAARESEAA